MHTMDKHQIRASGKLANQIASTALIFFYLLPACMRGKWPTLYVTEKIIMRLNVVLLLTQLTVCAWHVPYFRVTPAFCTI